MSSLYGLLAKTSEKSIDLGDIKRFYREGCKDPEDVAIGMEVEKHGIYEETLKPIPYFGGKGVRAIQRKMIAELGWKVSKREDKFLLALERCGTMFTLETSESMGELSGRTHTSIHDLARELKIHQHEVSVMSKIFGVQWLGIGIQPFSHNTQIRRLQSPRYRILYDYMESRNGLWEDELKKTASVQANIDFTSEDDARSKFQTLLKLSPFLGAMYAHSPICNGELTNYVSYRMHVLNHNDPVRFGIRKMFFKEDFGFEDWIDFCMDIPLLAVKRHGKWYALKNTTFRQFMKSGYNGFKPTLEDWQVHTGFVYSFVRIKKYIELRICDSVPSVLIPSIQAIVKAFVYHPDGKKALKELTKNWSFNDFNESYEQIARKGMHAEVRGKQLLDYCKEILEVASDNLKSLKTYNNQKLDESVYLMPIKDFVFVKEMSPGMFVAQQWETEWNRNPKRLVEWCRYE
jgi:glutamate--cysteine ligase